MQDHEVLVGGFFGYKKIIGVGIKSKVSYYICMEDDLTSDRSCPALT